MSYEAFYVGVAGGVFILSIIPLADYFERRKKGKATFCKDCTHAEGPISNGWWCRRPIKTDTSLVTGDTHTEKLGSYCSAERASRKCGHCGVRAKHFYPKKR